jgi:hypothetical protein
MLSKSKPEIQATSVEKSSSIRTEQPLSVLMDGDKRTSEATNTYAGLGGGEHCLFVDGEWNCVGERCSNSSHRLDC